MRMNRPVLVVSVILFLHALACSEQEESNAVPVAVSILPHAYLVERIGGDRVSVYVLVSPGESPATYQPSDQQVSELLRVRAYFKTGVPFEKGAWSRVLKNSGGRLRIVDLREGIVLRDIGGEETTATPAPHIGLTDPRADPHVWLSPPLLGIQARHVARILCAVDPEGATEYRHNLEAFEKEMADLHGRIEKLLAPFHGKPLFVYHPSWGYFCDTYGLRQVAVQREGKEPWFFTWKTEQQNLRKTFRRSAFLVTRLLANMGVRAHTPLLARFAEPVQGTRGKSVVKNGHFQLDADQNGMPDDWLFSTSLKPAKCVLEPTGPQPGSRCLRITCPPLNQDKKGSVMLAQNDVPVRAGQWYRISLAARSKDLSGARIDLALQDTKTWRSLIDYQHFTPTETWRVFTFLVQARATAAAKTRFQIWHGQPGTFWISSRKKVLCSP